jgi:hypothetical protein
MDDKDKLTIEGWSLENYANMTIGPTEYYSSAVHSDIITVTGSDATIDYDDWILSNIDLADIDIGSYYTNPMEAENIKLNGGGEEMIRIAEDGFYVRGERVPAGKKEAKQVYKAFKQWMTWAILNGEIKN